MPAVTGALGARGLQGWTVTLTSGQTPEQFFVDHPLGLAVLHGLLARTSDLGDVEVRVSKSQVALRRMRGFAYLWLPGRYLARPRAEVVLSVAADRRFDSPRWKQVVQPVPGRWMHHLEVSRVGDVDDEVLGWVHEAAVAAGRGGAQGAG